MDSKDRDFLRINRRKICLVDFDAAQVANGLYENKILNQTDKNVISIEEKDLRKKEKLLDILPKRGPKAFIAFVEISKKLELNSLNTVLSGNISGDVTTEGSKDQTRNQEKKEGTMDDTPDGRPSLTKDEKPKQTDTIDTPPTPGTTEEDGRPGIFGGSGKKKSKSETDEVIIPITDMESNYDPSDCYTMKTKPRGYFLLINNKHFLPSSGMENYPRNGTDVDGEAIQSLFKEMGFIVDAHFNLSVYEMKKVFKQAAAKDYSSLSCITCCVLSHGQEGVLYGTDGTIDIREMTSYFHGSNLAGKPKLFFFQACQGSEYMDGVEPDGGTMEVDGPAESNDISLPTEADFLYAYSTVPGYYSWRNSARGSWFVQAICEVFRRHAHKMDVVRMLTRVNAIVSTKKSQTGQRSSHHKRQVSSIVTQLRKELFFFPLHGPLKAYQGSY